MKPINNENQYEDALARVYELMQQDILPNSKESDELEELSKLISEYEQQHHSIL
jgi:HTH-type transcriptional regulator / antitoxin HigA